MPIRQATVKDAKAIQVLVLSLSYFYLSDKVTVLPKWFAKTLELSEFEHRLSSSEFNTFVYGEGGEIGGYIAIKQVKKQGAKESRHVYHLFVSAAHQGKGIAKQLWNTATLHSDIKHYTVRSSLNAVPVYKRFGFMEDGAVSSKDGICYQTMTLKQHVHKT
ncbi:GNAT family N-acetyltransferase [Marinomonas sp.]|nr:GNAT family N-acetyltransferase [Marinomonas sp.]MDB4837636.1 GNAT family N-acetyltransferase [Marinomonas sp.]